MNIEKIASWEEIHKAAKEARDAAEAAAIELEKGRIYLKRGEKPPKGVSVQRGKRGGMFYEPTKAAPDVAAKPTGKPTVKPTKEKKRKLWEPSDTELEHLRATEIKYGETGKPSEPITQFQKFAVQRIVELEEQKTHRDPAKVDADIKQLESKFGLDKRSDYFQEYAEDCISTDRSPGKIRINLQRGEQPPRGIPEKRDPGAKGSYWEIKVPVKHPTEPESKRVSTFQEKARDAAAKSRLKPTEIFEMINSKIEHRAPALWEPKREHLVDDLSSKLDTYLNEAQMSPETRKKTLQSLKKK